MKWICFFFIIISFSSCKKNIYKYCAVETKGLNEEEYKEVMIGYFDCLINERIKQKSKKKLIIDINQSTIESAFTGIAGELSDQFLSAKALGKIVSKEELLVMNISESPALRYYGFTLLCERDSINHFKLLKEKLFDTVRINTFEGCFGGYQTIADLCLTFVYPQNYAILKDEHFYKMSNEEISTLDSIVVSKDLKLDYLNQILFKYREDKTRYYQADYTLDTKTLNNIILSTTSNEYWILDKKDFVNSSRIADSINWAPLILKAKAHIIERFDLDSIKLISIELLEEEFGNNTTQYALFSFEKDNSGFEEKVPMLLDGRIVLSNKEVGLY